ncbi:hypothetical protein CEXT_487701 [Caerostris extrusa]|uniref:Uncharacterized protein n=1 Tax=Caerostris extrusa TaxID=172846 RepID=A0AAV4Q872_CAEEX|nr:hypothetical protein CEXT_487701 [Caerostris extrusa]
MSSNDINWSFYLNRTVHPNHLDFQMSGVSPKIPKSNDSRQNPDINHIRGHGTLIKAHTLSGMNSLSSKVFA